MNGRQLGFLTPLALPACDYRCAGRGNEKDGSHRHCRPVPIQTPESKYDEQSKVLIRRLRAHFEHIRHVG
jgi:hypothetical protein